MTAWRIPLSDVDLGPAEEEAVLRVIRSGWLTLGDEVLSFEREFAELHGADDAVALSSCTAALHLACVALGVAPGVEVIVPSLTFVATASAIVLAGGTPVFADVIGEHELTIDPPTWSRGSRRRRGGSSACTTPVTRRGWRSSCRSASATGCG